MRATMHNSRAGKDGAYLAKHNDRQFDTSLADNIDAARTKDNIYWHVYNDEAPDFETAEQRYYCESFQGHLDAHNSKARAARHYDRVMTMDDIYRSPRTCPEETLLQIGDMAMHPDSDVLRSVTREWMAWCNKQFPQCRLLDMAVHLDESTPHIHIRRVWVGHDKDGNLCPNQSAALREMHIERPDLSKPAGKYNNPKMTVDAMCRAKLLSLCREHGLIVESKPKDKSKVGLSMVEYQTRQEEENLSNLQQQSSELRQSVDGLQKQRDALIGNIDNAEKHLDDLQRAEDAKKDVYMTLQEAQKRLDAAKAEHDALERQNAVLRANMRQYDNARKNLLDTLAAYGICPADDTDGRGGDDMSLSLQERVKNARNAATRHKQTDKLILVPQSVLQKYHDDPEINHFLQISGQIHNAIGDIKHRVR